MSTQTLEERKEVIKQFAQWLDANNCELELAANDKGHLNANILNGWMRANLPAASLETLQLQNFQKAVMATRDSLIWIKAPRRAKSFYEQAAESREENSKPRTESQEGNRIRRALISAAHALENQKCQKYINDFWGPSHAAKARGREILTKMYDDGIANGTPITTLENEMRREFNKLMGNRR